MTAAEQNSAKARNGWFWVPTLYFAEGLPAALITTVSLVMFSNLALSERFLDRLSPEQVLFWTGLFSLPWMLRPLWVPVIDRVGTVLTDFSKLSKLTGLEELSLQFQPFASLEGAQYLDRLWKLEVAFSPALTDASAAFTLQQLEEQLW